MAPAESLLTDLETVVLFDWVAAGLIIGADGDMIDDLLVVVDAPEVRHTVLILL